MIKEEGLRDWFGKSKSKDGKPGWVQSDGSPCANEPGETGTPKCYSSAKKASMSKKELRSADTRKSRQDPGQQSKSGAAKPTYVSTDKPKKKMKEETFNEAEDKKGKGSGSKDACYSKVKSRYSVWPSAYASGALVKCRKVGASNWGNSTKKEGMEEFYNLPELTEAQIGALKYAGYEVEVIDEACWAGYEKKGMKTMFGKKYPNCVKKEETEVTKEGVLDAALKADKKMGELHKKVDKDVKRMKDGKNFKEEVQQLQELERTKIQTGNMYQVIFGWRGKMMMVKLFFPDTAIPGRQKVAAALDKMYPGAQLRSYSHSIVDYDDPYINVGESTLHEEKEDEKYCRLCEKKEPRSKCAYGPKMWDKYTVDNVDDDEKGEAASESGISETIDVNKQVQDRMQSDENRKRSQMRNKHRSSRLKQKQELPANQNEETEIQEATPAWQRKEGKSDSGGLNQKGVDSYRKSNPGSKLKTAVTKDPSELKKGGKAAGRRKSFCSRMKGMKKKLTSSKTANDPDSRINKSLRKWNC